MKRIPIIFAAALALLPSCTKEAGVFTVGEADNVIELSAGIAGSPALLTKAGAEDNHSKHVLPAENTEMRLQVIGDWWRTPEATSGDQIVKTTVATTAAVSNTTHRELQPSPVLYWDDYGTADPSNMTAGRGRKKGLTIYGVAVDGLSTLPTAISGLSNTDVWSNISWTLPSDQSTSWSESDLLISNNVKETGSDGCYKFEDRAAGKLLEFHHAMSMITVRLKAAEGFPTTGVGATSVKFAGAPSVDLTTAEATKWAYTSGTVDITDGTVANQAGLDEVSMRTRTVTDPTYTVIFDALVYPGSEFPAGKTIAKVTADGNIYYVSSDAIRTKMHADDPSTDYKTKAGVNYVLTVIVNKTKIDDIEATITDWTSIDADPVAPKVNVSASYGTTDTGTFPTAFTAFSFYRSTSMDSGYSKDATVTKDNTTWTVAPKIYWPTHNTHYQFRGVWPQTDDTGNTATLPAVTTVNYKQVIAVSNAAYSAGTFPSDLSIARPEFANGSADLCESTDHTKQSLQDVGICATEGVITLNFRYMMSKVEVNLVSADGTPAVNLSNAKVELVNAYSTGNVTLGTREASVTGTSEALYTLHPVGGSPDKRLDAIVPQDLTYSTAGAASNLRFKVTIYSLTEPEVVDDIYYADVYPILETGKATKVAPEGKWEAGKHYVYTLTLSKTQIKASATITDWVTVSADENVWF